MAIIKQTYKDFVIDHVYRNIMDGELRPGDKLLESELSASLGISRAPVREALRELVADGLLDYRPQAGACIAALSPDQIVDAYTTRGVLEGYAAALAAPHLTADDLETLNTLARGMQIQASAGENHQMIDAGEDFHRLIFERCPNHQLLEFAARLSRRLHVLFSRHWATLYTPEEVTRRHLEIVTRLAEGESQRIEACLRQHYSETGRKIADLYRHPLEERS